MIDGLGERTLIMGVLNVTPDSFSDGGLFIDVDEACEHARTMAYEGADIIDIGGESSRPGSDPVSEDDELRRVLPIIESLADEKVPISIDTYKPKVARACLEAGASMINDITGLPAEMARVAQEFKVPAIIMHMKGTPKTMQKDISYGDVIGEIRSFFEVRISQAREIGVEDIIIDPGIGFGKTVEHNLEIIRRLSELKGLMGCPVLVGPSRKSFIGDVTGLTVDKRLEGTLAAVTASVLNGADMIRVHDVGACKRAAAIADAIRGGR